MFRICSHTRTGTHLLAAWLWRNFDTGAGFYEDLHYSHSRKPAGAYIHLWRPCLPTMVSIWRAREHLGIRGDVSFADMLRTPWQEMPRAERCESTFNGERRDLVCAPRDFEGTLLERWSRLTRLFADGCTLQVSHDDIAHRPLSVLAAVAAAFGAERRELAPVGEQVWGWQAVSQEKPSASAADLELIHKHQVEVDSDRAFCQAREHFAQLAGQGRG